MNSTYWKFVEIPKADHGDLGIARKAHIEQRTGTKIFVPLKSDPSTKIEVKGAEDNVKFAIDQIRKYVKNGRYRIEIVHYLRPYCSQLVLDVLKYGEATAKLDHQVDEIVIHGSNQADCDQVKNKVTKFVNDLYSSIDSTSLKISKSQHRQIIIEKGISSVFEKTEVVVHVPSQDDENEEIVFVGPADKLEDAKRIILEIAAIQVHDVAIPEWIELTRGDGIRKRVKSKYPEINIRNHGFENWRIKGKGEPTQDALIVLEKEIATLKMNLHCETIKFVSDRHKFNFAKRDFGYLNETLGVVVVIPQGLSCYAFVIGSDKKNVVKAMDEDVLKKLDFDKDVSSKVNVPCDLRRYAIDPNWEGGMRKIQDEYKVQVKVPKKDSQQDFFEIFGCNAKNIDNARKRIEERVVETEKWLEGCTELSLTVNSVYLPMIIGRRGQSINNIRQSFGVYIDIEELKDSPTSTIKILGFIENAEKAKQSIMEILDRCRVNAQKNDVKSAAAEQKSDVAPTTDDQKNDAKPTGAGKKSDAKPTRGQAVL